MTVLYMTHSSCFEKSPRCDYDGGKVHAQAIYPDDGQQLSTTKRSLSASLIKAAAGTCKANLTSSDLHPQGFVDKP